MFHFLRLFTPCLKHFKCIQKNNCYISVCSINLLRHIRDVFNVVYKIDIKQTSSEEERTGSEEKFILSCLGTGFTNLSKTSI